MNKLRLIMRHEFSVTIRRRAFIILTLAFPLIAIIGMLASQVISSASKAPEEAKNIGYVDMAGGFSAIATPDNVTLAAYTSVDAARQALLNKTVNEYFVVPADYLKTGVVQRFTLNRELEPNSKTVGLINDFLLSNLLKGISNADVVARAKAPMNLESIQLTATGEVAPNQGFGPAFLVGYFFSMILIISIFSSSSYLLQGLAEEKENRVMEILLSSVSPKQLLAGKVLGLGAAGLVQVAIWLASGWFASQYVSSQFSAVIGSLQVPASMLLLGSLYFILGYLLYGVLMAGMGAISTTAREGQQMSALFTIPAIVPIMFQTFITEHPDGIVSQVLGIIPLTAPVTMMIRAGLIQIPVWELAVSVIVMILSVWGTFILATKLFRTYLLMYGKRPDFRDIMRSFRNA